MALPHREALWDWWTPRLAFPQLPRVSPSVPFDDTFLTLYSFEFPRLVEYLFRIVSMEGGSVSFTICDFDRVLILNPWILRIWFASRRWRLWYDVKFFSATETREVGCRLFREKCRIPESFHTIFRIRSRFFIFSYPYFRPRRNAFALHFTSPFHFQFRTLYTSNKRRWHVTHHHQR